MFVYVDDTLQLGLDCVAALSPRRWIAYGWAMTPRAVGTELAISAGAEGDCAIEYCSFHPRPDVVPADARRAAVNGFALVFAVPEEAGPLTFTLMAGDEVVRADLRDPGIDTNLAKATAERDWRAPFVLLQDCAANPALAQMLQFQHRPFGAFADWLAGLPAVRGKALEFGSIAEVEALASPAGEVMITLRGAQPMPRDATLEAALIGYLHGEDGGPPEIATVPIADWHSAALPTSLVGYARLDPAWLDRLQAIELVLQAQIGPEERIWLRAQPRATAIPEFLDSACRRLPMMAIPVEAGGSAALGLLRQVIARREAAFAPALAALAETGAEAGTPAEGAPRLALILGADDPTASRLFHVTAGEIERRCDTLLVMGEAADDVAQVFLRRGRVDVVVGPEAAQALREAGVRSGVVALDAARYAEAVAAGRPQDAFGRALTAADVARLLTLHAVGGCGTALSDSLSRLLRLRRAGAGEAAFGPVPHAWSSHHVADLVNDHLARLWGTGRQAASHAEQPRHV